MSKLKLTLMVFMCCAFLASAGMGASVKMKISGPGRIDDSTIRAGQKVDLDIYLANDSEHLGISMGFKITSPDSSVKKIIHPVDSGNGLNGGNGDIKGIGPFGDRSMFDLVNQPILTDWDGKLPDLIGFLTCGFKKRWPVMPETKAYSIELVVPDPGVIRVDSCFYPPGGTWIVTKMNSLVPTIPSWGGPYKFRVVK